MRAARGPASGGGMTESMDAAPSASGATTEVLPGTDPLPDFLPGFDTNLFSLLPDRACALAVGAQCDGDEDCAEGETCCGIFDSLRFTYALIECRSDCEGPTRYKLCHPGEACPNPQHVCRRSQIVPHDFIHVCFDQIGDEVPSAGSEAVAGEVACGSDSCDVGEQKCCLSAWFNFDGSGLEALEPYCAALSDRCLCSDQPPPAFDAAVSGPDEDAG